MTIHKLHIDEFDEIDYRLIAIHTPLEDYRLAYFINQNLPINLKKSNCDIHISSREGDTKLTRFIFEDNEKNIFWNLVQNTREVTTPFHNVNEGLFANSDSEFLPKIHLVPEFKKVDYFLKIENAEDEIDVLKIMTLIKKIIKVSTVYMIETEKIKSKNNLIF